MAENPLGSLADYGHFLAEALGRSSILHLRMREELDFADGLITSYGYEVYLGAERLYWYDDFPHPEDPLLAFTFPHHKHVPPDIKRNRVPAPNLQFTSPNLIAIVEEIEALHGGISR